MPEKTFIFRTFRANIETHFGQMQFPITDWLQPAWVPGQSRAPTCQNNLIHFLSLLGIGFDTGRLQQRDDGGAQHDSVSESFYA